MLRSPVRVSNPRTPVPRISRSGARAQPSSTDWHRAIGTAPHLRFLFILTLSLCAPSSGAAQFSVSPVIVTLPRHAGDQPVSGLISVRNESEEPQEFLISAVDFNQSIDGDHAYAPTGTLPGTCGQSVALTPGALSVDAGDVKNVRIEIPGGPPDRSCWFMVFVESPATSEAGVVINQRIGVKVFGIGTSAMPGGEIRSAALDDADGSRAVSFEFENPGKAPVWPSGSLEVRDYNGALVAETPVRAFTVLPQSSRRVVVQLPGDLEGGRYLAVPMLDFGGEYLAGTQLLFRVP
jgi:hypothetical protein